MARLEDKHKNIGDQFLAKTEGIYQPRVVVDEDDDGGEEFME